MTEFLPLIIEHDGEALTTSRAVADYFGKAHKDILRAIRETSEQLDQTTEGAEFSRRNFAPSKYRDERGKEQPAYTLTRDGFTLLAMGFTGAKALQFKIAYINAFNRMERLIHGAPLTGLTSAGEPQRALTAPQGDLFSREAGVFMEALVMALASGERVLVPRDMPIGEEPPNTIGEYTDVLVRVNFVEALELYRERSAAPVSRTAIKTALIDTGRAALLRSKKNVLTIRGRRVCALEFVRAQSPALNDVINHR